LRPRSGFFGGGGGLPGVSLFRVFLWGDPKCFPPLSQTSFFFFLAPGGSPQFPAKSLSPPFNHAWWRFFSFLLHTPSSPERFFPPPQDHPSERAFLFFPKIPPSLCLGGRGSPPPPFPFFFHHCQGPKNNFFSKLDNPLVLAQVGPSFFFPDTPSSHKKSGGSSPLFEGLIGFHNPHSSPFKGSFFFLSSSSWFGPPLTPRVRPPNKTTNRWAQPPPGRASLPVGLSPTPTQYPETNSAESNPPRETSFPLRDNPLFFFFV